MFGQKQERMIKKGGNKERKKWPYVLSKERKQTADAKRKWIFVVVACMWVCVACMV